MKKILIFLLTFLILFTACKNIDVETKEPLTSDSQITENTINSQSSSQHSSSTSQNISNENSLNKTFSDTEIREFIQLEDTENFVQSTAERIGISEFQTAEELKEKVDFIQSSLIDLYVLNKGIEVENGNGLYRVPRTVFNGYTLNHYGIGYSLDEVDFEYIESTDEIEFYPAGSGGKYVAKINSFEIKDNSVIYEINVFDGFDETRKENNISLTFEVKSDKNNNMYLKVISNKITK